MNPCVVSSVAALLHVLHDEVIPGDLGAAADIGYARRDVQTLVFIFVIVGRAPDASSVAPVVGCYCFVAVVAVVEDLPADIVTDLIEAFGYISNTENKRHRPFHTLLSHEVNQQNQIKYLIPLLVRKLPNSSILQQVTCLGKYHTTKEISQHWQ